MDLGRLFPVGPQWGPDGNLKAGGKGLDQYLWPFGANVDANGNIKPRGSNKPARSKPAYSGSRKGAMMGVPNDDSYRTEELEQGQKAEDFRKGAGFTGQTPTVSTRDVKKETGSGTQTSPGGGMPIMSAADAAAFYKKIGVSGGAFQSTMLPRTGNNIYESGSLDAVPFGGQETSVTGSSLEAFNQSGQAYAELDNSKPGSKFLDNAPNIEGGSTRIAQSTADSNITSSRLSEALNDTAGMQSYMSKFSSGDKQRAADMAFLNAKDSMTGLRAKEAELGLMYAGGQHYSLNADGSEFLRNESGKNIAADKGAVRDYKSGDMSAENFRDTFKGAVASNFVKPKDAENPTTQMPVAASQGPPNSNFGPVIDDGEMGRRLDATAGTRGMGPLIDNDVYGSFLDGRREPLMRVGQPSDNGMPLTVDKDDIPEDLNTPAGRKYLADLDAGRLTGRNPYSR